MSSAASLKTRCPVCNKKYELPVTAAGHKARCSDCQTVFRVPVPPSQTDSSLRPTNGSAAPLRPSADASIPALHRRSDTNGARVPNVPTEEDILRWLTDAAEEDADSAPTPQPRVVRHTTPAAQQTGTPAGHDSGTPITGQSGAPIPMQSSNTRTNRTANLHDAQTPAALRKTG